MVAMWAIALGIVVVQRDLGAALLFFAVFLALIYAATGRVSLVVIGLVLFLAGSALMANLFAHVGDRIDIWLDPWADPLDAGYQIVQSLHAFARGGLLGMGLGNGLPMVGGRLPIPEVHTDFPLAALGEELGLVGVVAILGLYFVVIQRGLRIGASAADDFRSILATGLALVVGVQAFIIAAGNLKVLPLTGVTLPFVSYGGSSLLANAVVIGLLLALSDRGVEPPPPPSDRDRLAPPDPAGQGLMLATTSRRRPLGRTIVHVALVLSVAFGTLAAAGGYWAVIKAPELVRSPFDAAVIAAARTVPRGSIVDRDGEVLARNEQDANGELYRVYRGAVDQPGRRLRLASLRPGRPRAGLRRGAVRAGRRPVSRHAAQVRHRPVRPQGPDAVAVAGAATRRRPRARRPQGSGRDARPARRRGPGPGLDPDV